MEETKTRTLKEFEVQHKRITAMANIKYNSTPR